MTSVMNADAVDGRFVTSGDSEMEAGGATMTSPRRATNQDRMAIEPSHNLLVVADGIGGMRAGECASQMAVDGLANQLRPLCGSDASNEAATRAIRQAFLATNRDILRAGDIDPSRNGMGTTAVLAMRIGQRLFIASLGDSRAYLLRGEYLWQYTVDHTMAEALVSSGVISPQSAERHPWRNRLWKHLGRRDLEAGPEVSIVRLRPNDRLLLASDGVTGVLDRHCMTRILASHRSPSQAARMLVQSASVCGTRDDATCIVAHF